jgi:FtsZ-binding cell division protein ZapB
MDNKLTERIQELKNNASSLGTEIYELNNKKKAIEEQINSLSDEQNYWLANNYETLIGKYFQEDCANSDVKCYLYIDDAYLEKSDDGKCQYLIVNTTQFSVNRSGDITYMIMEYEQYKQYVDMEIGYIDNSFMKKLKEVTEEEVKSFFDDSLGRVYKSFDFE